MLPKKNEISRNFPISEAEFLELDKKFSKLTYFASHQLKKVNLSNNFIDEFEDINQELMISLLTAGSYYKRQIYIEKCLKICQKYAKDKFIKKVLNELLNLWHNRTRHGAGRQKFGSYHEYVLESILNRIVPQEVKPNKAEQLKVDSKFSVYCKSIIWNNFKSQGRQITRNRSIRTGMVSLSEYDHMSTLI